MWERRWWLVLRKLDTIQQFVLWKWLLIVRCSYMDSQRRHMVAVDVITVVVDSSDKEVRSCYTKVGSFGGYMGALHNWYMVGYSLYILAPLNIRKFIINFVFITLQKETTFCLPGTIGIAGTTGWLVIGIGMWPGYILILFTGCVSTITWFSLWLDGFFSGINGLSIWNEMLSQINGFERRILIY